MKTTERSGLDVRVDLPTGIADRIILRMNNSNDTWISVNWGGARIVQMDGFAVPVRVTPGDPIGTIPPLSTVEYHLYPGHDYFPENRAGARRISVVDRLVYDDEFNRITDSGNTPSLRLHLPYCTGATCGADDKWTMAWISGSVSRRVQ
jgi:hypothetical protein